MDSVLSEILPYLPPQTSCEISLLPESEQESLREIRVKAECPLLLYSASGRRVYAQAVHTISDIETTFRKICASSAYSHRNEIRSGFVTLPGGHRVGIMGTAVLGAGGTVDGIRNVYGLSFRIARHFDTETDGVLAHILQQDRIRNLMLLGPPCSGKTTVLRSVAKRLSEQMPVSVIDEREELFPSSHPVPVGCDVLRSYPKAVGILQSLRTLSPRVIICDEIGTREEVLAMMDGLRSGVSLIVSAHAYSVTELFQRPPVRELFLEGGMDLVAFLDPARVGKIVKFAEREDLCVEMDNVIPGVSSLCGMGRNLRS